MTIRTRNRLLLVALLLVGAPFFFIGGPDYYASRSFSSAWNLGHIIFFALLTRLLCVYFIVRESKGGPRRSTLKIFLLILLIGVLIEVGQMLVNGRAPDLLDIARNQLGCLLVCLFFCGPVSAATPLKRTAQILVLCAITLAACPLALNLLDERLAEQQFPILANFETPLEKGRWVDQRQVAIERNIVRQGKNSLRVNLSTARYSGASLVYFPGNWEGYDELNFSVYNPGRAPLELHCRIHDIHHKFHQNKYSDRFHRRFLLKTGWNDLSVPLDEVRRAPDGRDMDMKHIERFCIFVMKQPRPLSIHVDRIQLTRQASAQAISQ